MDSIRLVRTQRGFTLMELMISVGIIGVMATIAVPNFLSYQARSRRSEAYTNLASLARAQKSYQAENDAFVDTFEITGEFAVPWLGNYPAEFGTGKMPWDADATTMSDQLGWKPEGQVFYSYDVKTGQGPAGCPCDLCFTATAHGDVDGDGVVGAVMYVHPQLDAGGNPLACDSYLGGYGAPTRPENGAPVYDEVAVYRGAVDDY
jgi:prepilin-type N-terminal cleavage/methylation domain-containing protein